MRQNELEPCEEAAAAQTEHEKHKHTQPKHNTQTFEQDGAVVLQRGGVGAALVCDACVVLAWLQKPALN